MVTQSDQGHFRVYAVMYQSVIFCDVGAYLSLILFTYSINLMFFFFFFEIMPFYLQPRLVSICSCARRAEPRITYEPLEERPEYLLHCRRRFRFRSAGLQEVSVWFVPDFFNTDLALTRTTSFFSVFGFSSVVLIAFLLDFPLAVLAIWYSRCPIPIN